MKKKIDGVLLLDKPIGLSSNAALQKVKWLYQAEKAGHTGTLDPLATGLLPICFGEATKFSSYLLEAAKEYIATIKLGVATTTYDAEGEITKTQPVTASKLQINECIQGFLGTIIQVPPIYSALKVKGKALYEYARSGQEVVIKSREINIQELEILEFIEPTVVKLRVLCSKGTYIRSLAHDIGQRLGCGAYLVGLMRTKTNDFTLDQAISMERISGLVAQDQQALLLPIDILVENWPRLELTEEQFAKVRNGHQFIEDRIKLWSNRFRLYYKHRFLGIANAEDDVVKPARLINQNDV
jgi:tRNA pseudouridine55 synthase